MVRLVQPLPDGPLDVVGDVHGHLAELHELLARLGYDEEGRHPDGRRLVFVGDLVDRGEDSPGVYRLVRRLIEAGRARMVLGNHELNLLLGKVRSGNEWFRGRPQWTRDGRLVRQQPAGAWLRAEILDFLRRQPLVLVGPHLRVVHACWHEPAVVAAARARDVVELFRRREAELRRELAGERDDVVRTIRLQNGNPVAVLTSGLEAPHRGEPFRAGGRERWTIRAPWWREYRDRVPVVFGHYWRSPLSWQAVKRTPGPFDAGGGRDPFAPLGPRGTAWCIDYSAGLRSAERRRRPWQGPTGLLVALRWPELEVAAASQAALSSVSTSRASAQRSSKA